MISNSTAAMTAIDIVIIAAVLAALWTMMRHLHVLRTLRLCLGFGLIAAGLMAIAGVYATDLLTMTALPLFASRQTAMALMMDLHLEIMWAAALVGVGLISGGLAIAMRDLLPTHQTVTDREEAYRNLLLDSPHGIIVHRNWKPLVVNHAAAEIFGYEDAEEIMKFPDVVRLVAPHDRKRMIAYGTSRLKGEPTPGQYEFQGIHRNGDSIWLEVTGNLVAWNGTPAIQVVLRDVTDRKRAEVELKQSRTSLDLAQQLTHVGSWERDIEFGELTWSDETYRIFGRAPENFRIDAEAYWESVHPDDQPAIRQAAKMTIEQGVPYSVEHRIVRPDGTERIVQQLGRVLREESGKPSKFMGAVIDITERKAAEAALQASEEKYRTLVEGSRQGLMIRQGNKPVYANRAMATIFGYRDPDRILENDSVIELGAPHERKRLEHYSKLRESGDAPSQYEFEGLRKDGRTIWLDLTISPVTWKGEPAYQATYIDITERKRAEAALRESESRLRLITDSIPAIIAYVDAEQRYQFVNQRWADWFGIEQGEILGKSVREVMGVEVWKSIGPRIEVVLAGDQVEYEIELHHQTLGSRHILTRYVPQIDAGGRVLGFYAMMTDITRVKEAENEIRRLNEGLEQRVEERTAELQTERNFIATLLDIQQALVAVIGTDGRVVRFNRACEQLSGYSQAEAVAKPPIWKWLIPPEERESFPARYEHLDASHFPRYLENEWLTRNGDRRLISWAANAITDDDGKVEYLISTGIDITEQRQTEQEMQRIQDELVRNEKMATLGQLTATVSHELRNPLGTIRSSLFTVQSKTADRPDLGIAKPLARIERNIGRCDDIITDLLDYSRNGSLNLKGVSFDDWLVEVLEDQDAPDWLRVNLDLDASHGEIALDDVRFRRVIINLYENAIHAMAEKRETDGEQAECALTVRSRADDGRMRLEFVDTGIGISKEVQERIFEPLFSTKSFGVGLGLATVRQIVQEHMGEIQITSEEGRGTVAAVSLNYMESQAGVPS